MSEKDSFESDREAEKSDEEIISEYETLSESESEHSEKSSTSSFNLNKEMKKEMKRRHTILFKYGLNAKIELPPPSPANLSSSKPPALIDSNDTTKKAIKTEKSYPSD